MPGPLPFFRGFTPAAHRGASREFPENTLEAFRRALEIAPGCLLETDVRMTRDGGIVIGHDDLLEMKTDATGPVSGKTRAEIASFDAGFGISFDGGMTFPFRGRCFRMPLLADALEAFPAARFSVDIKDNNLEAADGAMAVIREKGALARVIVGSFHERVIRQVRRTNPDAVTSCSKGEILRFVAQQKLGIPVLVRCGGAAILVPEIVAGRSNEYIGRGATGGVRIVTRRLIRAAHRRGIPVLAWTINQPDNMRRLIEWGIDGIVTDRIDLLKNVMREMGLT
jgi:glycerophosphoryl diester phosphodiesterase